MDSHRVRDGGEGSSIVYNSQPNLIQTEFIVDMANSGSSLCCAIPKIPDEVNQLAIRVKR